MNEIKIYLKTSGSFAELYKDFNLYQGCYRNSQISIYVPRSILYANAENTFANLVKVGGILTAPNGTKLTTKSYYLDYVKEETVNTIDYAVYTTITPKEFCVYAGTQTVVVNVENIDNTNAEAPTILSVTTTQTANLIVLESAYLGQDEPIDPTELEKLRATLTVIQENVTELQTSVRGLQGEVSGIQIDLEQVHTDLGNRVEKTTLTYSLYGTDKNGNQAIIPYGTTGLGNSIPQYTADSEIRIPASPTQSYYAANKGYVDAGLEEKLDKTGGPINGDLLVGGELRVLDDTIIIGNLTVHGTTITEDAETIMSKTNVIVTNSEGAPLTQLSGIGIRTNATLVYGIMYDPGDDTVKLGEGTLDANNEFTFNSGEGTAVATRADSAMWTNGHLSMWNAAEYRFVDSGIAADNVVTVNTTQQITGAKTFAQAVRVGTGNVYASYYTGGVIWRDSNGNNHTNIFPANSGTLALTSDIPTDYVTEKEFSNLAQQVEDLYALGEQGGLFTVTTVEDTYTAKETAGGSLNIADGVSTIVKTIKGSTVKTTNKFSITNLANTDYLTVSGKTITVTNRYDCNSLKTLRQLCPDIHAGTYTASVNVSANTDLSNASGTIALYSSDGLLYLLPQHTAGQLKNVFTLSNADLDRPVYFFGMSEGTVTWDKLMVLEGDWTDKEIPAYSDWFAGLKNASFEKIVSTGKNLIPYPYTETTKTVNGVTFTDNGDGTITVNGTATANTTFILSRAVSADPGKKYHGSGCPSGGSTSAFILFFHDGTDGYSDIGDGATFNPRGTKLNISIRIYAGATLNNLVFRPMLNFGATAEPYEPYKQSVLSLPEAVENPAYNTLDFQTGKNVSQGITKVFDGTEAWSINTTYNAFSYDLPVKGIAFTSVCSRYGGENVKSWSALKDFEAQNGELVLLVKDSRYTTVDEWKAYLAARYAAGDPLIVRYKTAEVQSETDLNASSDRYLAWKNGSETVVQGGTDNSEYGAENTVTQEYFTITGGTTNGN